MPEMTHKDAVRRMTYWLRNTKGCGVVMAELSTANTETPDVIGWHGNGGSILIECKVSRSDFLADKNKVFRRDEDLGMGDVRYFAAPIGLLCADEMPAGWGLLEIAERQVRVTRQADAKESNKRCEVKMLMSSIRRLQLSTAVFVMSDMGQRGLVALETPAAELEEKV